MLVDFLCVTLLSGLKKSSLTAYHMASSPDSLLCRGGVWRVGVGVWLQTEKALHALHCGTCLSRVRGGHSVLGTIVSIQHAVKCRKCAGVKCGK